MQKIDGEQIASEIIEELKKRPLPKKFLAGVIVGDDAASASFQRLKQETAEKLKVDYRIYKFDAELGQDELREEVGKIANHKTCGGILVQLPLPANLNRHYILNAIPREKDVDVLSERSQGAFQVGRNPVLPPAVAVVEEILSRMEFDLKGKKVAVVGPGFLVGKPVSIWLTGKATEVCVLGKGSDYSALKDADLVILGAGQAKLVKPDMLKDGAGVIDFSYSKNGDNKLTGDFDVSDLLNPKPDTPHPSFYTPTPGGTGPILVAKLLENFYTLNKE